MKHLAAREIVKLQHSWVGQDLGAPAINKKAGVVILAHKHLQYKVFEVEILHSRVAAAARQISPLSIYVYDVSCDLNMLRDCNGQSPWNRLKATGEIILENDATVYVMNGAVFTFLEILVLIGADITQWTSRTYWK